MNIRSIVIKGTLAEDGSVSCQLNDVRELTVHAWEYCFAAIEVTPKSNSVNTLVELSSNFHSSDQYNYKFSRILSRHTPYCLLQLYALKDAPIFFNLAHNDLWLPIEDVRQEVKVSIYQAGTDQAVSEQIEISAQMCLRRRQ